MHMHARTHTRPHDMMITFRHQLLTFLDANGLAMAHSASDWQCTCRPAADATDRDSARSRRNPNDSTNACAPKFGPTTNTYSSRKFNAESDPRRFDLAIRYDDTRPDKKQSVT